jgi:hypothetical protein
LGIDVFIISFLIVDIIGINRQITVLAFTFGEGFSNVLYPTNAVLLISLGLTVVSYPKWFIKLQLIILLITCLFLILALECGLLVFATSIYEGATALMKKLNLKRKLIKK